jgi:hypothetical protein
LNGINPSGRPYWDCLHLADMLIALGRAIPPKKWVEQMIEETRAESFRSLM